MIGQKPISGMLLASGARVGAVSQAQAFTNGIIAPTVLGGTGTTQTLTYQTTSGIGETGARHIFLVGNNGATEAMTILNNSNVGIGTTPSYKLDIVGSIAGSTGVISGIQNTNATGISALRIFNNSNNYIALSALGTSYAVTPGQTSIASSVSLIFLANGSVSSGGTEKISFTTGGYNNNPTMIMSAGNPGNVGIGTTAPLRILGIGGLVARNIGMERGTVADTAGFALTINAGGATAAATDKAGGILDLTPGISTGNAESGVRLYGNTPGGSGTSDSALLLMIQALANKLGFFTATPVVKQTGYAVPTDLDTCIAAVTALRTALNNYGLTTVVT